MTIRGIGKEPVLYGQEYTSGPDTGPLVSFEEIGDRGMVWPANRRPDNRKESLMSDLNREGTVETLNGEMTRCATRITVLEENTIPNITNYVIGGSLVVTTTFIAFLHSQTAPDSLKVLIPFSFLIGMLGVVIGAWLIEPKRHSAADERRRYGLCERELYRLNVRLPEWRYIAEDGKLLELEQQAITRVGILLVTVWTLWAVPQTIAVFRVLPVTMATGAIAGVFVVGWLLALLRNAMLSSDNKLRLGAKIWIMLTFVTLTGVITVIGYEYGQTLYDLLLQLTKPI